MMYQTIVKMNQNMKDQYIFPFLILLAVDFSILSLSFVASYFIRNYTAVAAILPPAHGIIPPLMPYIQLSLFIALLGVVVFDRFGFYAYRIGLDRRVRSSSMIIAITVIYIFLMAFLFNYSGGFSRLTVALALPVSCTSIVFVQHALRRLQFVLVKKGIVFMKTVLIGREARCLDMIQKIQEVHGSQYQILGYISPDENGDPLGKPTSIPLLGDLNALSELLDKKYIDNVIIALTQKENGLVPKLIKLCDERKVAYQIVPDIYDEVSRYIGVNEVSGLPFLPLGETPLCGFGRILKRSMDCLIAAVALIVSSPIIFTVALLIKLDSKGPVFFVQERVGNDGRKFNIYKFRSMIDEAERDTGPKWATANDPRTTRVGRLIRKYNLDELPQFLNVLIGEMSLVGPRPERPYFVDKFKEQIPHYMRRHMVKAGITGWAQVNGLRGDTSVVKRTKYDLYYVQNWSLWFDLKILLKTLTSFKNAY
ncbi:MAG: undecaprenyl-phosphate glucose phosphotransferase [bacterium]|jgi:exopolysaccharide biosynthesis polyprenyl glycosylphosphotransferase|nr:undecaprenyl-phosphate glucose phosphotransferase [bacterium]